MCVCVGGGDTREKVFSSGIRETVSNPNKKDDKQIGEVHEVSSLVLAKPVKKYDSLCGWVTVHRMAPSGSFIFLSPVTRSFSRTSNPLLLLSVKSHTERWTREP